MARENGAGPDSMQNERCLKRRVFFIYEVSKLEKGMEVYRVTILRLEIELKSGSISSPSKIMIQLP
ncbi:24526_t:CDS:2 [Gigaspora margarita]|uniref:24526_t:CDS:1 n=1 Tax=Gigaspora margarita TaxID=4874 RepID=A0ABN7V1J3_GIGMA|nr:24526_t:CDS:2 [Gigaspora margarita]